MWWRRRAVDVDYNRDALTVYFGCSQEGLDILATYVAEMIECLPRLKPRFRCKKSCRNELTPSDTYHEVISLDQPQFLVGQQYDVEGRMSFLDVSLGGDLRGCGGVNRLDFDQLQIRKESNAHSGW